MKKYKSKVGVVLILTLLFMTSIQPREGSALLTRPVKEKTIHLKVDDQKNQAVEESTEVIVLKEGVKAQTFSELFLDSEVKEIFENTNSISLALTKDEIKERLKRDGALLSIEEIFTDEYGTYFMVPGDPDYRYYQWNLKSVGMEEAWNHLPNQSKVTVAVIDTGVTPYFDLPNVIKGADLSTGVLREDTYPGEYSYDGDSHGTAVAATIAAQHNHLAIAGTHPGVNIMSVKVFPDGSDRASMNSVAAGIRWAADQGADIINLSLGSNRGTVLLEEAVQYAKNKEVLIVSSSGNDGYTNMISYPAAYSDSMAIGSSNNKQEISWFSNEGAELDLVAPGELIWLPDIRTNQIAHTYFSGTSFSAPLVSGVAALLKDIYPNLSTDHLREIMKASATDVDEPGWDTKSGTGIINASAAVKKAEAYRLYDNNDSMNNAERIYGNYQYEAYMMPATDKDFYQIAMIEPYKAAISFKSPMNLQLAVRITNEAGELVQEFEVHESEQFDTIDIDFQVGTYFIEVSSLYKNESMDPYMFDIQFPDETSPKISVVSNGENRNEQIEDEGIAYQAVTIDISDSSYLNYKEILKDNESIGDIASVEEEGNYVIKAKDSNGNEEEFEFVLDYDGQLEVKYIDMDGEILHEEFVPYGDTFKTYISEKENHHFAGWFLDEDKTMPYTSENLRKNIKLYGQWIENPFVSLTVETPPLRQNYFIGEELILDGLRVFGTYENGQRVEVDPHKLSVTGFDSTMSNDNLKVNIRYNNVSTFFTVKVRENHLVSLHINNFPKKRVYLSGDLLDLEGLEVIGIYADGQEQYEVITHENVEGFNSEYAATSQEIRIKKEGVETQFTIEILRNARLTTLAGEDRFKTAVALSQEMYTKADTVILVQGMNFPDALSAGPIAYALEAPILLTRSDRLSEATLGEIKRLEAKEVILFGGINAISEKVEKELALYCKTTRIQGGTRYDTSIEAAKYLSTIRAPQESVYLVSGKTYADALSIGSVAAKNGNPILLTSGTSLSQGVIDYLNQKRVMKITIIGGEQAISKEVEESLKERYSVERISGENRYKTSLSIAKKYYEGPRDLIVANGMQFADALAATPYAAAMNAPLVLVDGTKNRDDVSEYLRESYAERIMAIGGEGAISFEVKENLLHTIR